MIPDNLICAFVRQGRLRVDPFDLSNVQPVSYELHLGSHGLYPTIKSGDQFVDLADPDRLPVNVPFSIPDLDDPVRTINPREFMNADVDEIFEFPADIAGEFHGKSTLGRAGLLVHVTAGLVDPGWRGRLTVELVNLAPYPIRIWHGMPIGQMVFYKLTDRVDRPYGSKELNSHYQGDDMVVGSRGFVPMRDPRVRNFQFSNFERCEVELDGSMYPTVEHAYQAAKSLDASVRLRILLEPTPGGAKRLGRKIRLRPDWQDVKIQVMTDLLLQKFSNEPFQSRLLATKNERIVEWNDWHDNIWGICVCTRCPNDGQNLLGTVLEEIRATLVAHLHDASS